jgi:hypothetical protein
MIILFNGPPRAGKDEAADFFKAKGFKHLSFKYQLYRETCKYFNCDYKWFMNRYDDRSVKEVPHVDLGHMSCREAMIYVSEKVVKPKRGLDYFGRLVANEIKDGKDYCISDGGFIDELVPVINKVGSDNFVLCQLTREGCDYSTDSRRYFDGNLIHEYVNEFRTPVQQQYVLPQKFDVKTYRIHNNSSIGAFHSVLQEIYEKEGNVTTNKQRELQKEDIL